MKRGHGPHPRPAATPEAKQAWKRSDGRQGQAVSSLSPARGTSCWRYHVTRHQAARPGLARPHPAQHLRLPGSTCDPTGAAPADPSRAQTPGLHSPGSGEGDTDASVRRPAPGSSGHPRPPLMCRLGFFRSRRAPSPSPSPSPKWLQLSGPQIGTAGTALARCPPPSRVCLRERKPAHLWNPSLSPRSPLPPVPRECGVSRPHSGALFPLPRSDYNAGSVPSTPPLTAKRPLWWGVARPSAPGHLLQLDLHKMPT